MADGRTVDDNAGSEPITRFGALADRVFLQIEIVAYILLGLLLAVAAVLGIFNAASLLLSAVHEHEDALALVIAIDRLLFVLMVVEILHTVRASFRSGTLVCEPFLVVGLIASIRRVLVIGEYPEVGGVQRTRVRLAHGRNPSWRGTDIPAASGAAWYQSADLAASSGA